MRPNPSRGEEPLDVEFLGVALRLPQIVGKLHLQPVLRRAPERPGQPQRHFRRDAGAAVENRRESLVRDAQALRRFGHAQIERLKAVLPDYFAGVRGIVHIHVSRGIGEVYCKGEVPHT